MMGMISRALARSMGVFCRQSVVVAALFFALITGGCDEKLNEAVRQAFPDNRAPEAADDSYMTDEDTRLVVRKPSNSLEIDRTLLANDSDPDLDELTIVFVGPLRVDGIETPGAGELGIGGFVDANRDGFIDDLPAETPGGFTFEPGAFFQDMSDGETVIVSFDYIVTDFYGFESGATVSITVTGINDAPTVLGESYQTDEGGMIDASDFDGSMMGIDDGVLANDSDAEGQAVTVTMNTDPVRGVVVVDPDGTFTFDTNGEFEDLRQDETEAVQFGYTVDDGNGGVTGGVAIVVVTGINDPPVAVDDLTYVIDENSVLAVNAMMGLVGNDTDVENDVLTASVPMPPAMGLFSPLSDGSFVFDPRVDFNNLTQGEMVAVNFNYEVRDPLGAMDTGAVTITVTGVNDAPSAFNDPYVIDEDTILMDDVLSNDFDPEMDTLTPGIVTGLGAGQGTLTPAFAANDGSFSYDPTVDFQSLNTGGSAIVSFTYQVMDGPGATSNIATVTVTVIGVNDAPVVMNEMGAITEDMTLMGNVLANDSDPEMQSLIANLSGGIVVDMGAGGPGTVMLQQNGDYTYDPRVGFNSLAQNDAAQIHFDYSVSDGFGGFTIGTVTVDVSGANDAPTLNNNNALAATEGMESTINNTRLQAADADAGTLNTGLVFTVTAVPANGQLLLNGVTPLLMSDTFTQDDINLGRISYEHNGSETLTDSFNFTLTDGIANVMGTFNIDVAPVNDDPVAMDDMYQGMLGMVLNVPSGTGVLLNDTDAETATPSLTATAQTKPTSNGGSVQIFAGGAFNYTPPMALVADDTFTYTVNDGNGGTDVGTVTIDLIDLSTYIFVDNSAPGGGDGSMAMPFNTLAAAEAASAPSGTIFVYEGTGTDTGMDGGIVLKADQQLIGEGAGLTVNTVPIVPAGNDPVISNAGGTAVTLASGAQVSGFEIGSCTTGIGGNALTTAPQISNMNVTGATGAAVSFTGSTTSLVISGLSVSGTPTNAVVTSGNSGNVTISDSDMDATGEVVFVTFTSTGSGTLSVTGTNLVGGTHGVRLAGANGSANLVFQSNTCDTQSANCVLAEYNGAVGHGLTIGGAGPLANNIVAPGGSAVEITATGGAIATTSDVITTNTITNPGYARMELVATGGTSWVELDGNRSSGGLQPVTYTDVMHGADGMPETIPLAILTNVAGTLQFNGDFGFFTDGVPGFQVVGYDSDGTGPTAPSLTINIGQNLMDMAQIDTINAPAVDIQNAILNVRLDMVENAGSTGDGIHLENVHGSFDVHGSTLIESTMGEGIELLNLSATTGFATLSGTLQVSASSGDGLLAAGVTGTVTLGVSSFIDPGGNALHFTGAVKRVDAGELTIDGATGAGIEITATSNTRDFNFGAITIGNRGARGIFIDTVFGGTFDAGVVTVNNQGSAGDDAIRVSNSNIDVTLSSLTVNHNSDIGHGIYLLSNTGDFRVTGTATVDRCYDSSIQIDSQNGGLVDLGTTMITNRGLDGVSVYAPLGSAVIDFNATTIGARAAGFASAVSAIGDLGGGVNSAAATVNFNALTIVDSGSFGIEMDDFGGTVQVAGVASITDTGDTAILLDGGGNGRIGRLDMDAAATTITNPGNDALVIDGGTSGTGQALFAALTIVNRTGMGVLVNNTMIGGGLLSTGTLTIHNPGMDANDAIQLVLSTLPVTFGALDIDLNTAGADGIELNSYNGTLTVTNTTGIVDAAESGIEISGQTGTVTFTGALTINGATESSINYHDATLGTRDLNFGTVNILSRGNIGFLVDTVSGGTVDVASLTIPNPLGAATVTEEAVLVMDSSANVTLTTVDIDDATHGLYVENHTTGLVSLNGGTINGTTVSGVTINNSSSGRVRNVTITGVGNSDYGVVVQADSADTSATIHNVTTMNTDFEGVYITAFSTNMINLDARISSGSFTSNGDDGVEGNVQNANATLCLNISNPGASASAGAGGFFGYALTQTSGAFVLDNFVGDGMLADDVNLHVTGSNAGTANAIVGAGFGTGTCVTPAP